MARRKVKVTALAAEAASPVDEVVKVLQASEIRVHSGSDYIPKSQFALARSALGLDRRGIDQRSIINLTSRTKYSETDVRRLLQNAGLLRKIRLSKVPLGQLGNAETLLGIRKNTTTSHIETDANNALAESNLQREVPDALRRTPETDHVKGYIIGKIQDIHHLSPADIKAIHFELVKDFKRSRDPIDPPGVKSISLLESAAGRPKTSLGRIDKYPTAHMAGAALTHSIVHNHPFHNGNKRTALVSLLVFLDKNGLLLQTTQDEMYHLLLQIASHRLRYGDDSQDLKEPDAEVEYIAMWLSLRTREIRKNERRQQWRHLRKILYHYNCQLYVTQGNRINISRGSMKTQVAFKNWGTDVEIEVIRKIRTDLELDEKNGYDSDIFYTRDEKIPKFINNYRKLLSRLAKV